jgi:hypothetical protein
MGCLYPQTANEVTIGPKTRLSHFPEKFQKVASPFVLG